MDSADFDVTRDNAADDDLLAQSDAPATAASPPSATPTPPPYAPPGSLPPPYHPPPPPSNYVSIPPPRLPPRPASSPPPYTPPGSPPPPPSNYVSMPPPGLSPSPASSPGESELTEASDYVLASDLVPSSDTGSEYGKVGFRRGSVPVPGAGAMPPPSTSEKPAARGGEQPEKTGQAPVLEQPREVYSNIPTRDRIGKLLGLSAGGIATQAMMTRVDDFKNQVDPARQAVLQGRLFIPPDGVDFGDPGAVKHAANEAMARKFGIDISVSDKDIEGILQQNSIDPAKATAEQRLQASRESYGKKLQEKLKLSNQEFLAMQRFVEVRYMLGLTDAIAAQALEQAALEKYLKEVEDEEKLYRDAAAKPKASKDPFAATESAEENKKMMDALKDGKIAAPVPGYEGLYMRVGKDGKPQFVLTNYSDANLERTVHGLRHSPVVNWRNIPTQHRAKAEATSLRAWKKTKFDGQETELSKTLPANDPGNWARWLKNIEEDAKAQRKKPQWQPGSKPEDLQRRVIQEIVDAKPELQKELAESLLASDDPGLIANAYKQMTDEQKRVLVETAEADHVARLASGTSGRTGLDKLLAAAQGSEDPTMIGQIYARIKDPNVRQRFAKAAMQPPTGNPEKVGQSRSPALIVAAADALRDPKAQSDMVAAIGDDDAVLASVWLEASKHRGAWQFFYDRFDSKQKDSLEKYLKQLISKSKVPAQQEEAKKALQNMQDAKQIAEQRVTAPAPGGESRGRAATI